MASSSAGQALRFVIAWMWSMGWSGSYIECTREASRPWPSGWRTRMSASARRAQMSVSSRAMTTARPGVPVELAAGLRAGGAGHGVGLGGQFAGEVHAGDEVGAVLLAGGGDHRLELVVRLLQPARGRLVAALGDVLGVRVGVGGEGAGEHLEAGDEAVAVGHMLEERAEAVDEGFLVLAVAQADAGALDLDGGGDGAAVGVQQYGDLVRAEGRGQPVDPADAGRRADLDLAAVGRVPASMAAER